MFWGREAGSSLENPTQEKYDCVSRDERQRELVKRRLLFWAGRLELMPQEVAEMSQLELNRRLKIIKKEEDDFEWRKAQFERWKELHKLRYLMYEEQRKYNERYGPGGVSIWTILAVAQQELEKKLQIDRIRGSCQRFPSPMTLMAEQREIGGRQKLLEPLRSVLSGYSTESEEEFDSDEDLELRKVTRYLPTQWPKQENRKHVQFLASNAKKSLESCKEPSNEKFNLHAKSEDSFQSVCETSNLGYCPLCNERHLRLPPRF
ncbi:uncharacterized protein LOC128258420 [Drosophila gunungcola]|nr:uncharacterized protein LOC128258420 [Drosophila gunungcola]